MKPMEMMRKVWVWHRLVAWPRAALSTGGFVTIIQNWPLWSLASGSRHTAREIILALVCMRRSGQLAIGGLSSN